MDMGTILLLALAGGALLLLAVVTRFSGQGSLNNIKSKTVGDGQHGTARWATKKEIRQTYAYVPFQPERWRKGKDLPQVQGLVLGCVGESQMVMPVRWRRSHTLRKSLLQAFCRKGKRGKEKPVKS